MTVSLLLGLLATAAVVGIWGTIFGLIAEDPLVRARGWAMAALGVAIAIAACGEWHGASSPRVVSAVVILVGGRQLLHLHRPPTDTAVMSDRITT